MNPGKWAPGSAGLVLLGGLSARTVLMWCCSLARLQFGYEEKKRNQELKGGCVSSLGLYKVLPTERLTTTARYLLVPEITNPKSRC